MYCNQCEQTSKGIACTVTGVCGKKPEVAALQDVLLFALKELSMYADQARQEGILDPEVNHFTVEALFSTLTNVNFDPQRFLDMVTKCVSLRENLKTKLSSSPNPLLAKNPTVAFAATLPELIKQGEEIGFLVDQKGDADLRSLQELLIYGLKGVAAYAHHALILGKENDNIYAFIHSSLAKIGNPELDLNDWLELVMQCGEINLAAMELLDAANTETFGHPVPTEVPLGHKAGKCILVSGHDLKDLKDLLEATQNSGINIYTHGEMLPAHGYPELKKYPHLYGNYGTAWQNQKKEFVDFPGPILMTTNCIQEPQENYRDNIFTAGPVGWPGIKHAPHGDFAEVIAKAKAMPGFSNDEDKGSVMVGFARNSVMGVADQIIAAVKSGDLKHIFLVGGCDGAKPGRNYFTEFVEKTPDNTAVLTLGCGKYRFYDKQLGTIGDIPRLLDIGQCNDAYSAIQIAVALSQAFECGVNDLPLSMVLSWYEQKAVSILLTLLYLGIKDIRLGPSLPAFVSPNVLDVLVKNFDLKPISTVEQDLTTILA
ncbi:Hydroxylamine reductase [Syntrophomonas zehnderi OL-4]|uniref:Hydroxylamine reductase n=1 Tax=Syntrophomonas zehnderi OL-4 TaxID=690567 RepID=A0A0E3W343_9FIRM|nr:hydroxylamine reductase [Syntrophomonas zehnderi]CFX48257.1 Hydroxylamine reductase [Syntrophomonas zehnderi OL-4]